MVLYYKLYELYECKNSYYYKNINNMVNPFTNSNNAFKFIMQYFKAGEKEQAFEFQDELIFKKKGKHIHTVTMYFLGILLRDYIESINYQKLEENIDDFRDWHYNFTYTWFLTCLYHDTGSAYERRTCNNNFKKIDNRDDFVKRVFENYDIKYCPFEDSNNMNGFQTYNKDIIKNYFFYRYDNREIIDHGILGGYLLFDRLSKNYWEAQRKYNINNERSRIKNDFIYRNLAWKMNHIEHFAYVSDAILAHNIWTGEDTLLYEKYGLENLLNNRFSKLTREKNPLAYFLGLVDTIEPTKCLKDIDSEVVLKGIDINFNVESKSLVFQVVDDHLDYLKWFLKIEGLSEWLEINISINSSEKKLTLVLN